MENKRYSIVRVDDKCPFVTETENSFCMQANDGDCSKCKTTKNYGDTKKQLIHKIAQAIREQIKKNYIDVNIGKIGYFIRVEELAKEIVEFLGVE